MSSLISCVTESEFSDLPELNVIDVSTSSDILILENTQVDIFFYNSLNSRFFGIKDNQELEIPVSLDLEFDIPKDSYGFNAHVEKLIQVNDRYDLVKGSVVKFIETQNFVRNDTIFRIQGFNKESNGDFLLFDKQTYNFIDLEEGFWINDFVYNPIQVINDKLFYIKNISWNTADEIKFIDLNNLSSEPQLFYSSEHIISFIINSQMDLHFRSGIGLINRYVSHQTGQEIEFFDVDNPLKLHFIGLDGEFYAQSFFGSLEQPAKGFYSIDIQGNFVDASEIFFFNSNDYPSISFLGDSDIVIPNTLRNNNLIIGTNTGMYIYELFTDIVSINPIDIEYNSLDYVGYYENEFLILIDFFSSEGDYRLRKFSFSNFNTLTEINLGQSNYGIIINPSNGSTYSLAQQNEVLKFVEIKSDNTITELELTNELYGYFSAIN